MKGIINFILFVLAIVMLSLWIKYISIQFDVESSTPLNKDYWIFSGTNEASVDVVADEYFFSPLSVDLILSGEGYTSAYNYSLTNILYESHKPLIREVLSSSYACSPCEEDIWDSALMLDDFVMIEYPEAFPYTVISLFLENNQSFPSGEVARIKNLMLFSDENENLTALSKDSEGKVFSYTLIDPNAPSLIYDFNSNNLAAYTVNKGFTSFAYNFNAKDSQKNVNLPSEYKLLSASPKLESVGVIFPLKNIAENLKEIEESSYPSFATDSALDTIFNAFEINPNIVGYYTDSLSGNYFVGETMMLAIDNSGALEYSATDKSLAPVTVASLLNSERTDFSINEIITAATAFLDRLPFSVIGEQVVPILDGLSYSTEKDELTLTFSYYYELCRVLNDGKKASLTLTFGNNALTSAKFLPVSFKSIESPLPTDYSFIDVSFTPDAISKIIDDSNEFAPVYNITEDSFVLPLWVEISKGGSVAQ